MKRRLLKLWRKLCGWRYAEDYGAKGDGITDDTEAIQRAINDCRRGVVLSAGVHVIGQVLKNPRIARFLKRLEGVNGKTDVAARSMSIAPATIRVWRHRNKEFDRECREVVEKNKVEQRA